VEPEAVGIPTRGEGVAPADQEREGGHGLERDVRRAAPLLEPVLDAVLQVALERELGDHRQERDGDEDAW
jgi:hypothetical protein